MNIRFLIRIYDYPANETEIRISSYLGYSNICLPGYLTEQFSGLSMIRQNATLPNLALLKRNSNFN